MADGPHQGCVSFLGKFYEGKYLQDEDKSQMFIVWSLHCPQSILSAYPELWLC